MIVSPSDATLGATVRGVDLRSLADAQWREIEEAFHAYAVLVFPAQHLDAETQVAFARRFGRLERGMGYLGEQKATIYPISNVLPNGVQVVDRDHVVAQILIGNQVWHTDSSYHRVPAKASVLSADVVPAEGGGTEWADMRAAWDALPGEVRERIEGLVSAHSYLHSQRKVGRGEELWTELDRASMAGVEHPLVSRHPVTGRRSLFIGRHAYAIRGMRDDAAEALLAELLDFACRPPRLFGHRWQVGDLAVWDNRCLLHRGRPWDLREPRVMKHTRVAGDGPNEWALAD
jgi:alpha-ketoglutarate-dependent taurine dioxygenase